MNALVIQGYADSACHYRVLGHLSVRLIAHRPLLSSNDYHFLISNRFDGAVIGASDDAVIDLCSRRESAREIAQEVGASLNRGERALSHWRTPTLGKTHTEGVAGSGQSGVVRKGAHRIYCGDHEDPEESRDLRRCSCSLMVCRGRRSSKWPSTVIAEVKLTHPRRSNFDPPGRGWRLFSSRRDVDPGASGGGMVPRIKVRNRSTAHCCEPVRRRLKSLPVGAICRRRSSRSFALIGARKGRST